MKRTATKKDIIVNFIWRYGERCGAQGVSFIVSLVLARLLMPDDYGTITLVTVFTNILTVFIDSGMGNALIQKKNADDLDFSSVFYFNMFMCIVLYIISYIAAPYIAIFYNKPELTSIIRVLCLTFLISGVRTIQQSYVSKHLLFKRFFFSTLGGTIGSAVVGIIMAYKGFGVWALVAQGLFNAIVDTAILWITVKWRPKLMFSFKRLKSLFSFGWKMLVSRLIDVGYNNLRQLIIGKLYSTTDLAFYNKGYGLPNLIINNVNSSIDSVLMPVMSDEQDDISRVRNVARNSMMISTYIMAPLLMGVAFTAPSIVKILFTEKWLPCVPFMRIFCITSMFYPVHTANLNAIKALGRSDLFLALEIIKKVMGLLVLFISMRYGIMAMAYSTILTSVLSQIINSWPNKKLLKYTYLDQMRDILPGMIMAAVMGVFIIPIEMLNLPSIITLIIQVIIGTIVFITGSKIFGLRAFQYICNMLKIVAENRKKK